jgi:hypothetical protein
MGFWEKFVIASGELADDERAVDQSYNTLDATRRSTSNPPLEDRILSEGSDDDIVPEAEAIRILRQELATYLDPADVRDMTPDELRSELMRRHEGSENSEDEELSFDAEEETLPTYKGRIPANIEGIDDNYDIEDDPEDTTVKETTPPDTGDLTAYDGLPSQIGSRKNSEILSKREESTRWKRLMYRDTRAQNNRPVRK